MFMIFFKIFLHEIISKHRKESRDEIEHFFHFLNAIFPDVSSSILFKFIQNIYQNKINILVLTQSSSRHFNQPCLFCRMNLYSLHN
jgi:hypothetical protein